MPMSTGCGGSGSKRTSKTGRWRTMGLSRTGRARRPCWTTSCPWRSWRRMRRCASTWTRRAKIFAMFIRGVTWNRTGGLSLGEGYVYLWTKALRFVGKEEISGVTAFSFSWWLLFNPVLSCLLARDVRGTCRGRTPVNRGLDVEIRGPEAETQTLEVETRGVQVEA